MHADDIREMSDNFVTEGESLGARLRARRKAIGKTMQQVADEANLTIGFISQIERGISSPSLASLYNVAKALDASVDMFVSQAPARSHSVVTMPASDRPSRSTARRAIMSSWSAASPMPSSMPACRMCRPDMPRR